MERRGFLKTLAALPFFRIFIADKSPAKSYPKLAAFPKKNPKALEHFTGTENGESIFGEEEGKIDWSSEVDLDFEKDVEPFFRLKRMEAPIVHVAIEKIPGTLTTQTKFKIVERKQEYSKLIHGQYVIQYP